MEQKYLYIVFSCTPNRMGTMIRRITGDRYNHVSIALDGNLSQMYGFARRFYHTPFYGGFVKESVSRYHINGHTAQIQVCRLPVTAQQHNALQTYLTEMLEQQEQYLYNHLSAAIVPLRRRINIRDSYICVDFAVEILKSVGIALDPKKNFSVGELEQLLRPHTFYTGAAPEATVYDTTYFAPKPIPHPVLTSFCAFFELISRLWE